MEQNRGNQYDDDLTVGLDDIADESFDTGYVDLFEYAGDEESPISKLKTLMLSIEWEITDQVLIDFNEELLQAQQAWFDDPVKMVYIQALQKITKYIYQKKAAAHHNAMKVLISFFYDLEKIVLDENISAQEKEEILLADVKKFERLKQQIAAPVGAAADTVEIKKPSVDKESATASEYRETSPDLYNLKALILSIDWEITDRELSEISKEVKYLQTNWSDSKVHSMLLQGIDALGGYIKLMKSASHGDAFKLLNSFFLGLEKVVDGSLGSDQIKALLISEADKFNQFKEEIAESITAEAIADHKAGIRSAETAEAAMAADSEGEIDKKAALEDTSEFEQTSIAEDFGEDDTFSEETLEKVSSFFGDMETDEQAAYAGLSAEEALRGVEVETEADDDSDEEALPTLDDGLVAPALAALEDDVSAPTDQQSPFPTGFVPGVDVESDADDDSDEPPLPLDGKELAPALVDGEDSEAGGVRPGEESATDEISKHVDDFFADSGLGFDSDETDSDELPVSPALSGVTDSPELKAEDDAAAEDIEGRLDNFLNEDDSIAETKPVSDESFAALKANVDSLKEQIDEDKLASIQSELSTIKEALADKPIEKTLTHLISAVVENIGKKSGQFDDEAVDLLHSVFGNLENIRSASVDQNQALIVLSNETAKILQWQQRMVNG